MGLEQVLNAQRNWDRYAGLLQVCFPELKAAHGIVESELHSGDRLQSAMTIKGMALGRWFIKGDHALPVAGSIKARGGLYEVLIHAEALARSHGLLKADDDRVVLASPQVRELFARHRVSVGSTGNLGLSIGVMAAALGFKATVHMSRDAKKWKKVRLRERGVEVIEHEGDFGTAVAAGRAQAHGDPDAYFVDDENSGHLFLGYSVAALRLQQQLKAKNVQVDAQHPLFVYLPCGVGGAPGGITFGLRHAFGDFVHCFFAEPVASPCLLVRLASIENRPISVREIGLDSRTDADGLAVGQASELVAAAVRSLVSGVFTVSDQDLFEDLYRLEQTEGLRIEPSAAAGFRGPRWILESESGRRYLADHYIAEHLQDATHILWTTGGAFVPVEEYRQFHQRGQTVRSARANVEET
jgi:D-serine dehydratase